MEFLNHQQYVYITRIYDQSSENRALIEKQMIEKKSGYIISEELRESSTIPNQIQGSFWGSVLCMYQLAYAYAKIYPWYYLRFHLVLSVNHIHSGISTLFSHSHQGGDHRDHQGPNYPFNLDICLVGDFVYGFCHGKLPLNYIKLTITIVITPR